jgi:hypothetical protein
MECREQKATEPTQSRLPHQNETVNHADFVMLDAQRRRNLGGVNVGYVGALASLQASVKNNSRVFKRREFTGLGRIGARLDYLAIKGEQVKWALNAAVDHTSQRH